MVNGDAKPLSIPVGGLSLSANKMLITETSNRKLADAVGVEPTMKYQKGLVTAFHYYSVRLVAYTGFEPMTSP